MKHEGDDDTNCSGCTWNDPQKLRKEAGRVRNRRTNRNHPNNSIVLIGQNTEKSPGDLWRLAVTQIPVTDHQLTLVEKNSHGLTKIIIRYYNWARGSTWNCAKKLQFDSTNKWYMHYTTSVLENETYKLLWDFKIQTDHLISARRPDLIIKKNIK